MKYLVSLLVMLAIGNLYSQEKKDEPKKEVKKESGVVLDALSEVNAARAKRGLRPYINDPVLNKAALACARYRAERLMAGHCDTPRGDFSFLPEGYDTNGVVGGCAGLTPDWGFQACAMYDNYKYCGAASVMGRDGKRYCHLFCK